MATNVPCCGCPDTVEARQFLQIWSPIGEGRLDPRRLSPGSVFCQGDDFRFAVSTDKTGNWTPIRVEFPTLGVRP